MAFKMKSGNSPSFKSVGSYTEEEESPNKFLGKALKKGGKFAAGGGLIGAGIKALTGKNKGGEGGGGNSEDCDCEGQGGSGEAVKSKPGIFGGFGAMGLMGGDGGGEMPGLRSLEKFKAMQEENQIKKEQANR